MSQIEIQAWEIVERLIRKLGEAHGQIAQLELALEKTQAALKDAEDDDDN